MNSLFPFLDIGVILPVFNVSGKYPDIIQLLNSFDKVGEIILLDCLTNVMGISLAFPFSNSQIIVVISLAVQSSRNIDDSHGIFIYVWNDGNDSIGTSQYAFPFRALAIDTK